MLEFSPIVRTKSFYQLEPYDDHVSVIWSDGMLMPCMVVPVPIVEAARFIQRMLDRLSV
jgi:hypothetical protein